jgi:hypothetical protein
MGCSKFKKLTITQTIHNYPLNHHQTVRLLTLFLTPLARIPNRLHRHPSNMSAPNAGRQSPEPEKQSDAQAGQTTGNVNDQGGAPSQGADKASDETKSGLSSNPTHPLAKHAEETTSKK